MGVPVLILGESGTGKTYSLKGLPVDGTCILMVEKQHLPFRSKLRPFSNADYNMIGAAMKNGKYKRIVVDDSQYLLINEFFDRAKETGYQKFTDIALRFRNMIHFVIKGTPDDVIVYFLHHTETDSNGKLKAKTIGKMLDEKLTVEGCFDIVLRTITENGQHFFLTQGGEYDTVKTPEEMFPSARIANDLNAVDKAIREYYSLSASDGGDK